MSKCTRAGQSFTTGPKSKIVEARLVPSVSGNLFEDLLWRRAWLQCRNRVMPIQAFKHQMQICDATMARHERLHSGGSRQCFGQVDTTDFDAYHND